MMNDLFPSRWRQDHPPSLDEFIDAFPDDYACAEYLARKRWPRGFVCPRCGGVKALRLEARPSALGPGTDARRAPAQPQGQPAR